VGERPSAPTSEDEGDRASGQAGTKRVETSVPHPGIVQDGRRTGSRTRRARRRSARRGAQARSGRRRPGREARPPGAVRGCSSPPGPCPLGGGMRRARLPSGPPRAGHDRSHARPAPERPVTLRRDGRPAAGGPHPPIRLPVVRRRPGWRVRRRPVLRWGHRHRGRRGRSPSVSAARMGRWAGWPAGGGRPPWPRPAPEDLPRVQEPCPNDSTTVAPGDPDPRRPRRPTGTSACGRWKSGLPLSQLIDGVLTRPIR
jgi:hypothetical protein